MNRILWKTTTIDNKRVNWVSSDEQFCLILNYLLCRRIVNVNDLTDLAEYLWKLTLNFTFIRGRFVVEKLPDSNSRFLFCRRWYLILCRCVRCFSLYSCAWNDLWRLSFLSSTTYILRCKEPYWRYPVWRCIQWVFHRSLHLVTVTLLVGTGTRLCLCENMHSVSHIVN